MKEVIIDFLQTLSNCILIIGLFFAGFLLLTNLYHYKEINYKYDARLSENVKYNNFTNYISLFEEKMNEVSINNTRYTIANQIKGEVLKCVTSIKESKISHLTDSMITNKDIYDINVELNEKINADCLFSMGYNINRLTEGDESKITFKPIYENLQDNKRIIINSTDYLRNRLLANSTYSYVTDITRQSIFNESASNFSLTLDNYLTLAISIDDIIEWYSQEFGGSA